MFPPLSALHATMPVEAVMVEVLEGVEGMVMMAVTPSVGTVV